jgi:hypothetical protein
MNASLAKPIPQLLVYSAAFVDPDQKPAATQGYLGITFATIRRHRDVSGSVCAAQTAQAYQTCSDREWPT